MESQLNLFHTTDDLLEVLETVHYLSSKDKKIVIDKLILKLGSSHIFSQL